MASGMEQTEKQANSEVAFYVAPGGDDQAAGDLDTPFATLARARDAVRELKRQQNGVLNQPVTVFVRGGTYFLAEPLVFTPEDSGTAENPALFRSPTFASGDSVTLYP